MTVETARGGTGSGYSAAHSLRGSNQTGMRAFNQRLVLSLIYSHGSRSKTDIARMTGLSAQTVSVIMRDLEAEGLLTRGQPIRGRVGQPSIPFSINPDGAYGFGLKVGRRSAELVLADFLGRPKRVVRTSYSWPTPADISDFAQAALTELLDEMDAGARARIAGLGIAAPFELWNWTEQAGAPIAAMDAWREADLRSLIAAFCDFPVHFQNDATAACAAELVFGGHSELTDFLYLFVGTFVGGGVVLNGSIYSGRTGNAGALAPMPIAGPDGKPVQLLERASIMTLERRLRAAGRDPSPLWAGPEDWRGLEDFVEAWIPEVAQALAQAIISAASVIDFRHAIIDGGVPTEIRERIVAEIRHRARGFDLQGLELPEILPGTLGNIARALGAASLPLFDRYLIDRNTMLGEPQPPT